MAEHQLVSFGRRLRARQCAADIKFGVRAEFLQDRGLAQETGGPSPMQQRHRTHAVLVDEPVLLASR